MDDPITDVAILVDPNNCPDDYTVLTECPCGHDAQLWEKVYGGAVQTRYLCFTKTPVDTKDLVIEDMYIPSAGTQTLRPGYSVIARTMEGEREPLRHKQLALKKVPRSEAKMVVVDVFIARGKEKIPKMFTKLEKINGVRICFRRVNYETSTANSDFANLSPSVRQHLARAAEHVRSRNRPPTPPEGSPPPYPSAPSLHQLSPPIVEGMASVQLSTPHPSAPPPSMSHTTAPALPVENYNSPITDKPIKRGEQSAPKDPPPSAPPPLYQYSPPHDFGSRSQYPPGGSGGVPSYPPQPTGYQSQPYPPPAPSGPQAQSTDIEQVSDDLVLFKNQPIGSGTFSIVFKGEFDKQPCAVKVLQTVVNEIHLANPVSKNAREDFILSEYLESFKHPNIVCHLATRKHPPTNHLVLVLELMDCNLRQFFTPQPGKDPVQLSLTVQSSLCLDIASGLEYIHSRDVIHRNLCSENILLACGGETPVAKLCDAGMSNIIKNEAQSVVLFHNGYVPPEATDLESLSYSTKFDIFSFGALMIQIVRHLPNIRDKKERGYELDLIEPSHPIKVLVCECLCENSDDRPSATQLERRLKLLMQYFAM